MTGATMTGRAEAAAVIAEHPMPRRVKQLRRWCNRGRLVRCAVRSAGTVALSGPANVSPQILRPGDTRPRSASLYVVFDGLMAPFGPRREAADRKICCAGLTRWLNATAPSEDQPLKERHSVLGDRQLGQDGTVALSHCRATPQENCCWSLHRTGANGRFRYPRAFGRALIGFSPKNLPPSAC